jgi:hypothetical protein
MSADSAVTAMHTKPTDGSPLQSRTIDSRPRHLSTDVAASHPGDS